MKITIKEIVIETETSGIIDEDVQAPDLSQIFTCEDCVHSVLHNKDINAVVCGLNDDKKVLINVPVYCKDFEIEKY